MKCLVSLHNGSRQCLRACSSFMEFFFVSTLRALLCGPALRVLGAGVPFRGCKAGGAELRTPSAHRASSSASSSSTTAVDVAFAPPPLPLPPAPPFGMAEPAVAEEEEVGAAGVRAAGPTGGVMRGCDAPSLAPLPLPLPPLPLPPLPPGALPLSKRSSASEESGEVEGWETASARGADGEAEGSCIDLDEDGRGMLEVVVDVQVGVLAVVAIAMVGVVVEAALSTGVPAPALL